MTALRNATLEALDQVTQLITACDGPLYNEPAPNSQSGVGKHVRHILDHFLALQSGVEHLEIDYNQRHRESAIENTPALALELIHSFEYWLQHAELPAEDASLRVISEISLSSEQTLSFQSSLARELCYLINHTVHHVAYAKLVAMALGLSLDAKLGVAPSTATYLRQQQGG